MRRSAKVVEHTFGQWRRRTTYDCALVRKETAGGPYVEVPMTYEQLVRLAGNWNKEKKRDTSIKEVAVLDVLDQTAAAKVTAAWGIDYLLLGKYDGRWKIIEILWQSHPPKR